MRDQKEEQLDHAIRMLMDSGFDTRKIILKLAEALSASKNHDDDMWAEKLHDIATSGQ